MFENNKIILEYGDKDRYVSKIEITYSAEAGLPELYDEVLKPLLISMTFNEEMIDKFFDQQEPDIGDGLLDPVGDYNDLPPIESEFLSKTKKQLEDCSDLSTNDI